MRIVIFYVLHYKKLSVISYSKLEFLLQFKITKYNALYNFMVLSKHETYIIYFKGLFRACFYWSAARNHWQVSYHKKLTLYHIKFGLPHFYYSIIVLCYEPCKKIANFKSCNIVFLIGFYLACFSTDRRCNKWP